MTQPTVDIDQLRRQFPQQVVQYFDAVVAAKFQEVDGRIAAIEQHLTTLEDEINSAAQQAANQAEALFVQQALADLATALQPFVAAQVATEVGTQITDEIANGVFNSRTGARYKFYIDSAANIEALSERTNKMIYVGTDTQPDESDEEEE